MGNFPLGELIFLFLIFVVPTLWARRKQVADALRRVSEAFVPPGPTVREPRAAVRPPPRPRPPTVRPRRDESPAPRPASVPAPLVTRTPRPARLLPILATRAGLRQAILMQEILGPPKALRAFGRVDGNRTPMDGV